VLVFQRFSKMREEREGGFTLIELLVVILIIAILAAIAIPVFLRQREKGWRSQMQSALKNAATAQESFLTTHTAYATNAQITGATDSLEAEGYKAAPEVNLTVISSTATAYCMSATHDSLQAAPVVTYYYDSDEGRPTTTACT
jgi:type IV pilus assembly protein PilA